jgi:CheY-like chemotaxis protein
MSICLRSFPSTSGVADSSPKIFGMKTILLVDDDELLRELYGAALRKKGYCVIEAASGVEGFEKAQRNLPDLILTDICMPKEMARPSFAASETIRN